MMIPHQGIVLLIGASGSGKTTWLNRQVANGLLQPSEIVRSDFFRELVADSDFIDTKTGNAYDRAIRYEQYQVISTEAFSLLHETVKSRSRLNKCSFVDATNLHEQDRKAFFAIAKQQHLPIYGVVFDPPLETLLQHDKMRDQPRGKARIQQQARKLKEQKRLLKKEPFTRLYQLSSIDEIHVAPLQKPFEIPLGNGLDLIGDIHGCYDEMIELIIQLGYQEEDGLYTHPKGRKLLSLGDIMSRGPKSLQTMQFWHRHLEAGVAYMVDSNHGYKIARYLDGQNVTLRHGDEKVAEEITTYEAVHGEQAANTLKEQLKHMLQRAPSHYIVMKNDVPQLVATHAGIRDRYIGKDSPRIRDFCRYGDVSELDTQGRPVRQDWTQEHLSELLIVWGHEPQIRPLRMNQTINIDQGIVFGGQLTAYRYPENQYVRVQARMDYAKDLDNPLQLAQEKRFDPPNIQQFVNGFDVDTGSIRVRIPSNQAKAAIDTLSHYTLPLEQIVYIPPTMSPTPATSSLPDYLEHPQEAFAYYHKHGVEKLIAEKKHMGSRAVLLIFKTMTHALQMIEAETLGVITTRTGRAFFTPEDQQIVVARIHQELIDQNYFEQHQTDFVLMDAEILPWNLKAQSLIDEQYAHVAEQALMDRHKLLQKLQMTEIDVQHWTDEYRELVKNAARFDAVFQNYTWDPQLERIQIAPFHILAHSNETHFHQSHIWHMKMAETLAQNSSLFIATDYKLIETPQQEQDVIAWWQEMTEIGHEGVVIKPQSFITKHEGKLLQPAIKVRGREYLRMIYGMDYTEPRQMQQLKKRNPNKKMRHAVQEFALGMEGIERWVAQQSLTRVHSCVLATLALESDALDPRL